MTVSLIIPCYNEEINIQKGVLDRIGNYTKDREHFMEVIVVDDGSDDKSATIIEQKYLSKFPKLSLVRNKHQGKAMAVIAGIKKAKGDFVIFLDMDLATPIEETQKLIKGFEQGYDVAIGSRAGRREGAPLIRKIQSNGFMLIRNFLMGTGGIRDTQCGCKGFSRKAALSIIEKMRVFTDKRQVSGPSVSAAFDLEFLFLAQKLGFKMIEIPVLWRHAETKRVAFWKDSFETLYDLGMMRWYAFKGKYNF